MSISLDILTPSGQVGFVEYKRSFVVNGKIKSDANIPNNCTLLINIKDNKNNIVRFVKCDKKNKEYLLDYPSLIKYPSDLDVNDSKLKEFGFPELIVNDINNPNESIKNATIKCWFSDTEFKAIITSGSDINHGCIFDDGMNFVDENNNAYTILEKGNYLIEVILKNEYDVLAKSYKDFVIGQRDNQLICRFYPLSHKQAMIKFSNNNNYSIITDLLPGYLDSYLGVWLYHKGLLKMYRANDICLFEKSHVRMFNYLIDETSTSYATELAYLQNHNQINTDRFTSYYYDIGEAIVGINKPYERKGIIKEFGEDEYGLICRIDEIDNSLLENTYYIDERNTIYSHFDLGNVSLNSNKIAIMGVIKPIQLNPNDFILKDDNTYEILDYPYQMIYLFNIDDKRQVYKRYLNMERIDTQSIGKSVFEFYNTFELEEYNQINISVECVYKKGKIVKLKNIIIIKK